MCRSVFTGLIKKTLSKWRLTEISFNIQQLKCHVDQIWLIILSTFQHRGKLARTTTGSREEIFVWTPRK